MGFGKPFQKGQPNPGFKKGQSGNPSGLPKALIEVHKAAREYTAEALKTLADIMRDEKKAPAARVSAAIFLVERGWGKAPQTVTLSDNRNLRDLSDAELIAVALGVAENGGAAGGAGPAGAPQDKSQLN